MKECRQFTVKVTEGNAFQLLLPLRTARWEKNNLVVEDIDIMALQVVSVTVDGKPWTNFQLEQQGPMLTIPATMPLGAHDVVVTATYYGVEVQAAYYECFTIVRWSYESNVGNFIPDSPMTGEAAYVYVGITDDEELETLKQQYRDAIAAAETERHAYEAAKDEYTSKTEALDDVAKESSMVQGFDNTLNAIHGISVSDESAHNLAQFFGITSATAFEAVTEQEIIDELNNLWDISLK